MRALLRYSRRGWFRVWDVKVGTVNVRTGEVTPDRYGCTERRFLIGPYSTAGEALA